MLSQHSRSQARVKEGCDRLGEPTKKLSHSYGNETLSKQPKSKLKNNVQKNMLHSFVI
uniref:Uncharacterized protein n=1 Tax=Arundo donax TaxID=35708 RepID=A0A0A9DKV5_ARUDO